MLECGGGGTCPNERSNQGDAIKLLAFSVLVFLRIIRFQVSRLC